MRIERVSPPPPPQEFRLSFSATEGWAVVAALFAYAEEHPGAANAGDWRRWAKDLDTELRRGE